MIELAFYWLFWSKFLESYQIVVMKLIKVCCNLIKTFDLDGNKVNFNQKWSNLIRFGWILTFSIFYQLFQSFNRLFWSFNWSLNWKLVNFNQNWTKSQSSTQNRRWNWIHIIIVVWTHWNPNLNHRQFNLEPPMVY